MAKYNRPPTIITKDGTDPTVNVRMRQSTRDKLKYLKAELELKSYDEVIEHFYWGYMSGQS